MLSNNSPDKYIVGAMENSKWIGGIGYLARLKIQMGQVNQAFARSPSRSRMTEYQAKVRNPSRSRMIR